MRTKPILLFDGKCSFCRIWIDYWRQLTGERIDYAPSQEAGERFPQITRKQFSEGVQLVQPDGSYFSNARAVFATLGKSKVYDSSRIVAGLSEFLYRQVAGHRDFFYHLTTLTFGKRIEPARFTGTQWLFLRVLAVVYAAAFASLAVQITGLIGVNGISPVRDYLANASRAFGPGRFMAVPTIFWWGSADETLRGICWSGVIFSALLLTGKMTRLVLAALFVLYLSVCSVGQDFLTFQWDALLLEAGFLAIFLGRGRIVVWLFRWLLFRLYFLSGSVKLLSGDLSWHNLTALDYHYHTQPLPVVLAWYVEKLPRWFSHGSTAMVLFVELVLPFLIFTPRRIRMFAAWGMIGLQVLIALTGNYAFFNLLTVALCLFLFDDRALRRFFPKRAPEGGSLNKGIAAALVFVVLTLGFARIYEAYTRELPEPLRFMTRVTSPFLIVNSYGLFAIMTTSRTEIVVEGSNDGEHWTPYEFRYKPGDVNQRPRWAAPHQPRLDWQMWFAALGTFRENLWVVSFAEKLLEGSPPVLALLEKNPFPNQPPQFVRAVAYDYSFTDWSEHRRTGAWWKRRELGLYLPAIGLKH